MGRLFGTDGARGIAVTELTCELAMKLGRAAAAVLINKSNRHPRVIIGKDTRLSSDMLENAISEEYYSCTVEIGGKTFYQVGIRPKGNTSLSNIANDPTTDRYSFKLEFDHYVEGQTCFGLDKLVLNNNYADATNMKEALIYDMYQYLGADASLYNYAKVSVCHVSPCSR